MTDSGPELTPPGRWALILLDIPHARKITARVNGDEFGLAPAPTRPHENRPLALGAGAAVIDIISFVALPLPS